ncbi:MAG: phage major capsid protein [Atopobiaceae bacterium]|nr:phage major capsid protein [Atopobiaceae bacterium]
MPNIKELQEQRKAAMEELKAAETKEAIEAASKSIEAIDEQIEAAEAKKALIESLGAKGAPVVVKRGEQDAPAKTLGEHFVKFRESHGSADNRIIAPPFAAKSVTAGDPTTSSGLVIAEYDREPVRRVAAPLTVLDLFTRKTISGPVYTWFVYKATTGSVGTTAEGASKNKVTYEYESKSATLQKVTGLIKVTEELFDDAEYIVDAINQDLIDDLEVNRQTQAVTTLLSTSGLRTDTVSYSTAIDIFQGILDVAADIEDATNIAPDAVVVTPAIWKILRGAVDKDGHFYAGDPFSESDYKRLFELTFVKNSDVTAGHIIVGAFGSSKAAELVSKRDGVRVDSTNSNDVDFEKNLVSIRGEAREILAVKRPGCFCNVTLSANPS